jgi:hypothetical protein
MFRSTARISTPRADRYREQLARHGAGMMRQHDRDDKSGGPPIRDVRSTDDVLVLDLAWGTCAVTSSDGVLILVAEAASAADLARLQAGVAGRVRKIGRRDGLEAVWSPVEGGAPPEHTERPPTQRRGWALGGVALAVVVGVAIAIHLGLGAVLLRQGWAWWVLAGLGAVVVLKLLVFRHAAGLLHRRIMRR